MVTIKGVNQTLYIKITNYNKQAELITEQELGLYSDSEAFTLLRVDSMSPIKVGVSVNDSGPSVGGLTA